MDKKYWNSRLRNMQGYTYGLQPEMTPDTVKLNTNECPYPPSPRALEAVRAAATERLRLYPRALWDDLREAISERYAMPRERIFCSNGSDELLSLLFRTFTDQGDPVTFTWPTYSLYPVLAEAQGVVIRYAETDTAFRIPFAELPASGGRLLLITNPNAPTGILEPLAAIEACVRDFPGVVVVDEAYIDFADNPEAVTALPLVGKYDNLLVARTFSKSFALCGIRAGYCFGHEDLVAALVLAKDSYNLDMLAQAAAAAAMRDCGWMEANAARVRATRERAALRFTELGFTVLPSQANFLFVTRPGSDAATLCRALGERHIHVRHFPMRRLEQFLRVSIGTDAEMERLFTVLAALLERS